MEFNKIQNWLISTTVDGDSNSVSFNKCKNIPNLIWIMKDKFIIFLGASIVLKLIQIVFILKILNAFYIQ